MDTPAGMLTSIVVRTRLRPSPLQSRHGEAMTVPKPWQRGQGDEVTTLPRKERCMCWMEPRPLHSEQVTGLVPSAQHEPPQVSQVT